MKVDPAMLAELPFELQAEISENLFRKDWTPSEIDAVRRRCESLLKAQAKKNQATAGPQSGRGAKRSGSGKFPEAVKGQTRDKIGAFAGISGRTVEKIAAVCAAAEAEPEKYGHLRAAMDKTGCVNSPYKRLKVAKQAELIRAEPPLLPGNGPYRVGVVDLPWPSEPNDPDPAQRAYWPYPTMSLDQMRALDVGSLMHEDAILWFWVTNFHHRYAYDILDAWGFPDTPTTLTWVKDKGGAGHGYYLLGQTEHAIVAVRGKPVVTLTNQSTVLHALVRGHSVKPVEFYDLVEKLCPAPRYADLFSRYKHSDRWDCHGDQAPPATEAAP